VLTISFTSPNSVFLIHHEFEGDIRCVIGFFHYCISPGVLCIFSPSCTYIYIWASGPHMNISAIHNTMKIISCMNYVLTFLFFSVIVP
jgi:hypothetical protein